MKCDEHIASNCRDDRRNGPPYTFTNLLRSPLRLSAEHLNLDSSYMLQEIESIGFLDGLESGDEAEKRREPNGR